MPPSELKSQGTPGVRFEVRTPSPWIVPEDFSVSTLVPIRLWVENASDQAVCFFLFDTFNFTLTEAGTGRVLRHTGGRDGVRIGKTLTEPVSPDQHYEILTKTRLEWAEDGKRLTLSWNDVFGGTWKIENLSPGEYVLQGFYENKRTDFSANGVVWSGSAKLSPVSIRIVLQEH